MWQLLMKSSQIQLVLILIYGVYPNESKQLKFALISNVQIQMDSLDSLNLVDFNI